MLHPPDVTPLSDFVNLDERNQMHVLHELQKRSLAGDGAANVRLLFAEALQVVASLHSGLSSTTSATANGETSAQRDARPAIRGQAKSHEDTTSSYLNAIMLFNAAFEAAESADMPESIVDDYIFVRAVYTRLHRVQAAISVRLAEDIERDLRQFAKNRAPEVRPAHFNAIISRAFDAVSPPDDNYWAQLEHVPAEATAPKAEK